MDECTAWLFQGIADHEAAIAIDSLDREKFGCHVIAKLQQAVEKLIKSIVASLRDAGILAIEIGFGHSVSRFVATMLSLPHAKAVRLAQRRLWKMLDAPTRAGISAIDELVPRRPPPGTPPTRNTEYPFQTQQQKWAYPALDGVFDPTDLVRFRAVANRIRTQVPAIVSAIRHQTSSR